MKFYMYYNKKTDRLFATTTYKDLKNEFEDMYDMSQFYLKIVYFDTTNDYKDYVRNKFDESYQMWRYTLNSPDGDVCLCMPGWIKNKVDIATDHIKYAIKSAMILSIRFVETTDIHIKHKYLDAINDMQDAFIDQYQIFIDLFKYALKYTSSDPDTLYNACDILNINNTKDTLSEKVKIY
ncbi:hypothetical protein IKN40_04155 [bacterium]|nr:hypothetical protein [bacterium]